MDYYGRDWGGIDFPLLTSADTVYGVHRNVRRFVVPSTANVKVKPFSGSTSDGTGSFIMYCRVAKILGTLDASGAGYGGGGGGGGVGSSVIAGFNTAGTGGPAGAAAPGGQPGTAGSTGPTCALNSYVYTVDGGFGGAGGGDTFAIPGAPGAATHPATFTAYVGAAGTNGGYGAAAVNADTTTGTEAYMGAGGGGGQGGGAPGEDLRGVGGIGTQPGYWPPGQGGGGAGGTGGGAIQIFASAYIYAPGVIMAKDVTKGNGEGGTYSTNGLSGGNANSAGSDAGGAGATGPYSGVGVAGGNGGRGSGGGVVLAFIKNLAQTSFRRVIAAGSIDNSSSGVTNGGTVKILAPKYDLSGVSVVTSREYSPRQSGANKSIVKPFGGISG